MIPLLDLITALKTHIRLAVVSFLFLSAVLLGAVIMLLLTRYSAYSSREFMPPRPTTDAALFTVMEATGTSHVGARHFNFTTNPDNGGIASVAELFEPQLVAEGWEKLEATNGNNLFISHWRHKSMMNGGLHLAFSIIQLHAGGKYFGTMEAIPYWNYQGEDSDMAKAKKQK